MYSGAAFEECLETAIDPVYSGAGSSLLLTKANKTAALQAALAPCKLLDEIQGAGCHLKALHVGQAFYAFLPSFLFALSDLTE